MSRKQKNPSKKDSSWVKNASCKGLSTDLFYPDLDTGEYKNLDLIVNVCRSCPVRLNCIDESIASKNFIEPGYWGLDQSSRLRIKKRLDDPMSLYGQEIEALTNKLVELDA